MREVGDVMAVGHQDRARSSVGDADRLDDLLVLQEPRRRRPVGEEQAVTDEVAVVQFLAEVAPVAVAVLRVDQTMVDPLPDEAALAARAERIG